MPRPGGPAGSTGQGTSIGMAWAGDTHRHGMAWAGGRHTRWYGIQGMVWHSLVMARCGTVCCAMVWQLKCVRHGLQPHSPLPPVPVPTAVRPQCGPPRRPDALSAPPRYSRRPPRIPTGEAHKRNPNNTDVTHLCCLAPWPGPLSWATDQCHGCSTDSSSHSAKLSS